MQIKTYRAKSIQQALQLVRSELGPDASVLHTRRLNTGLLARLMRGVQIEVAATVGAPAAGVESEPEFDHRQQFREAIVETGIELGAGGHVEFSLETPPEVESDHDDAPICEPVENPRLPPAAEAAVPTALFDAFTALIEAEIDEPVCRDLLDRVRSAADPHTLRDSSLLQERLRERIAAELTTAGPIRVTPGERCVVALVGPTGVGKTTTLAKLAANFRLKQNLRVGLITVDTYRVAAVEQLRTYADIIDLPMEVVATPREMRRAIQQFVDFDLVLLDTAGRSPRDAAKVQELRSILAEARPDEVHLVLSTTAGARSLLNTVDKFTGVGVTSLLLTKLDEATGLGNVLSLARGCEAPISYVTNGQNVPDDIAVADAAVMAEEILPASGNGGWR